MNQFPPQPQSILYIPVAKFATSVNDIGGKIAVKSRCTTGINDTGGKLSPISTTPAANCNRYQRHWRQILPPVSLVLLTLVANLPLVSTIPVVANREVNLKAKIYICYLFSSTVSQQNYYNFSFAICVNNTGGPRILKKFETDLMVYRY
jgi:hypothetical protein